jgi:hypothetical protein
LNVVHPADRCFAAGSTFSSAHDLRAHEIACFLAKYHVAWMPYAHTCTDHVPVTHVHKVSKHTRTIDYVCHGAAVGHRGYYDVTIAPEIGFNSDHHPLLCELSFYSRQHRKTQTRCGKPRLAVLSDPCSVNRFAALLADVREDVGFEELGSKIYDAHRDALPQKPTTAKDSFFRKICDIKDETRSALDAAESDLAKREILREASRRKRSLAVAYTTEKFLSDALTAPRADRSKGSSCTHPVVINDAEVWDPVEWDKAFRKYYSELFGCGQNDSSAQYSRLCRLAAAARCEPRVLVPSFLVRQVLSEGPRKKSTAPGPDGVAWSALSALPENVFLILCNLIEARINGDENHDMVLRSWSKAVVTLIPKRSKPREISHWRPITLSSVLQKLYLKVVILLLQKESRPIDGAQFGFSAGRQAAEPVEMLRNLLAKGTAWGRPFAFCKADINRAFDNIDHGHLQRALEALGAPPALQAAVFRELTEVTLDLAFQGHLFENIALQRGGRQGGSDTPFLWNVILNSAVTRAKAVWRQRRLGIRLPLSECAHGPPCGDELKGDFRPEDWIEGDEFVVYLVGWADDLVLCAENEEDLHNMWLVLTHELLQVSLSWKIGSMEMVVAGQPSDSVSPCVWSLGNTAYTIPVKSHIVFLGGYLRWDGDPVALADHRIAQAWVHFWARQRVLCCRRIPLFKRWQRLFDTILRTALYLAGLYGWHIEARHKVGKMLDQMLMFTLARKMHSDEEPGDFVHRMRTKLRHLKSCFGLVGGDLQAQRLHCGWIGHVFRQSWVSPVMLCMSWRDERWWAENKLVKGRPKYALQGKPKTSCTSALYDLLGTKWSYLAHDRETWKLVHVALGAFPAGGELGSEILKAGAASGTLSHISNKLRDFAGMAHPGKGRRLPCAFVSDCRTLVDMCNGRARDRGQPAVENLKWHLYLLQHRLGICPASQTGELAVHVPRGENTLADSLANAVLDGSSEICWTDDRRVQWKHGLALHVFSDGACRKAAPRLPGRCSCAAVVQLHDTSTGVNRILGFRAFLTRDPDSWSAEVSGMELASRLVVQVLRGLDFW